MRSFFSTLLLNNWGFLSILLLAATLILYIDNHLPSEYRILLMGAYIIFALFGTFNISFNIARKVTEPLSLLSKKTSEINAGDFGIEIHKPDIFELAKLVDSINQMARRLRRQFVDLSLEKEKFNSVLENLKEGVFLLDQDFLVLYVNKAFEKFTNQSPLNSKQNASEYIMNKDVLTYLEECRNNQAEVKGDLGYEGRFYSIKVYPLFNDNLIFLYIGVITDITEEKKSHLIREEFFQNASHELKTPITSIKGYTETLFYSMNLPENSKERRFFEAIIRNVDRMVNILEDMMLISNLEFSKGNIDRKSINAKEFLKTTTSVVQILFDRKSQNLIQECSEDLKISVDPVLYEHLIVNLLSNASKYSPEDSEVMIKISRVENTILTEVIDQGIGIPPEFRERIFERFFRVDSNRSRQEGGTGLGLSIVKHIAKLHDGEVSILSNPNGPGSLFKVSIPHKND